MLRYIESSGLIEARRSPSGYRLYGPEELQRLRTLRGPPPGPVVAFVRALLAVACSVPGLFGFALALFDRRGQTLQDKLCGCVVVVD